MKNTSWHKWGKLGILHRIETGNRIRSSVSVSYFIWRQISGQSYEFHQQRLKHLVHPM